MNMNLNMNMEDGTQTTTTTMALSGLGAARGTVLGMSLDKMSDSISGQTVVDPQGYLTSLVNTQIATNAPLGDIYKARLSLTSVRHITLKHGPGWIASARVKAAAGKTIEASNALHTC